jgi:ABC-2 type transport system ATP-binding protein
MQATPGDVIVVEDLVYRYPGADRNAIEGMSFRCAPGTATALLGPNGAGKSTTMDVMAVARKPTGGRVLIQGLDVVCEPRAACAHAAYLFQYRTLATWLTVEETARLGVAMAGRFPYALRFKWMPSAYRDEIATLANVLELTEQLHTKLSVLSGGQKRKAELLRALMLKPRVLFLDEPTVGLDPNARKAVWRHILALKDSIGLTLFMSTHYLDEAEDVDQVLVASRGKIVARGTPQELRREFTVSRVRLAADDPQALRAALEADGFQPEGDGPSFLVSLGERSVPDVVQSLKVKLTQLEIERQTLEDAYFSLTGTKE